MTRRGFTLLELLVALVVAALVSLLAIRSQLVLERGIRSRAERAGAAANLRTAATVLRADLGALGTDSLSGPDLRLPSASRIEYRGFRGLAEVCRVARDTLVLATNRLVAWRSRLPAAGRDSVLLYLPGDTVHADGWQPAPLFTGPFAGACPSGGAAMVFGAGVDSGTAARLGSGSLARVFESVAVESYGSGGTWQLGLEGLSAGASIQPFAGPIDPVAGFALAGWDRAGGATASVAAMAGLDLIVRTLARREVAVGPGLAPLSSDSLAFSIRLQNVP